MSETIRTESLKAGVWLLPPYSSYSFSICKRPQREPSGNCFSQPDVKGPFRAPLSHIWTLRHLQSLPVLITNGAFPRPQDPLVRTFGYFLIFIDIFWLVDIVQNLESAFLDDLSLSDLLFPNSWKLGVFSHSKGFGAGRGTLPQDSLRFPTGFPTGFPTWFPTGFPTRFPF